MAFPRQSGGSVPRAVPVAACAVGAAVLALALGPAAAWLAVPLALVAVSSCDASAVADAGGAAAITVLAGLAPGLAGAGAGPRPAPALLIVVAGASAAVLIVVRARLAREAAALRGYALTDPLTGLANRRSLLVRAGYELARHGRAERSFALVMLDLDGFKALNDRFGHPAGDDLLRDIAGALRRAMRAQDTVARFGGDEFCVLAPETDDEGTQRLAARITQSITTVTVGVETVRASLGIAVFPHDGTAAAELLQVADQRLLEAKRRRGRGRPRERRAA